MASTPALAPGQQDVRILVADDNDVNRQLLREMLITIGFRRIGEAATTPAHLVG